MEQFWWLRWGVLGYQNGKSNLDFSNSGPHCLNSNDLVHWNSNRFHELNELISELLLSIVERIHLIVTHSDHKLDLTGPLQGIFLESQQWTFPHGKFPSPVPRKKLERFSVSLGQSRNPAMIHRMHHLSLIYCASLIVPCLWSNRMVLLYIMSSVLLILLWLW